MYLSLYWHIFIETLIFLKYLIQIALVVLEKTRLCSSLDQILIVQSAQPTYHQKSMLLLYLSLQHKELEFFPGFSPRFFPRFSPRFELHGCFKQNQPHHLNCIKNHGVFSLLLYISVIDFWVKTGMLLSS